MRPRKVGNAHHIKLSRDEHATTVWDESFEQVFDPADTLAGVGLTLSDAVRILLTRVAAEGGLPAGFTADPEAHDAWFRAKVREALDDPRPVVPHERVTTDAQALIDGKGRARS